jgi:hypothetical protein
MSITSSNAIASMEIGGATGAFIDLKQPSSDDYDLRLQSSATGGSITIGSGTFSILGSGETMATFVDDAAVTLYENGIARLATTSTGATITGTAVATGLDINGAADISGTLTVGNVNVTGTLTGAIEADTVIATADNSDTLNYIAFFNNATGAQAMKTDTGLSYNASTNALVISFVAK